MGRPTKVESVIRKIEKAKLEISEKAANEMGDMFDIIMSVAKNKKATDASRMAAAKYIIEEGEKFLEEMTGDEEGGDSDKEKEGFFSTQPT